LKAIFAHLTGSCRGYTEVFASDEILIGTDAKAHIHFDPEIDKNTSRYHTKIQLRECDYILKDQGSAKGTLVNNRLVNEIVLKDGDLIEFGAGGPKVRFRTKTDNADVCKPCTKIVEDSLGIASTLHRGGITTATAFFKQLLWEAFTQTSRTFKIGAFHILFAVSSSLVSYFYIQYLRLSKTVEKVHA
jgi:hypothetical protein